MPTELNTQIEINAIKMFSESSKHSIVAGMFNFKS